VGFVRFDVPPVEVGDLVDALALAVEAKSNVTTGEVGATSLELGTIDTLDERRGSRW